MTAATSPSMEDLLHGTLPGMPRIVIYNPVLAFETGCPYRLRLEDWFAHSGEMPERIIEITSYHAMLGCVVAGMGISLLPRMVLSTFPTNVSGVRLYEGLGFTRVGVYREQGMLDGQWVDTLVMEKLL